jgi:hypothetical protein
VRTRLGVHHAAWLGVLVRPVATPPTHLNSDCIAQQSEACACLGVCIAVLGCVDHPMLADAGDAKGIAGRSVARGQALRKGGWVGGWAGKQAAWWWGGGGRLIHVWVCGWMGSGVMCFYGPVAETHVNSTHEAIKALGQDVMQEGRV